LRYLDDPEQMVVSVAVPMSDAKLEALLTSQAVGPEGAKEPEVEAKGKAAAEGVEGAAAAAAPGAPAPAAGAEAKPGEKKEGAAAAAAAAPKAEKKEAEKKK
jgi:large subunit ribosomal protein L25